MARARSSAPPPIPAPARTEAGPQTIMCVHVFTCVIPLAWGALNRRPGVLFASLRRNTIERVPASACTRAPTSFAAHAESPRNDLDGASSAIRRIRLPHQSMTITRHRPLISSIRSNTLQHPHVSALRRETRAAGRTSSHLHESPLTSAAPEGYRFNVKVPHRSRCRNPARSQKNSTTLATTSLHSHVEHRRPCLVSNRRESFGCRFE